MQDEEIGRLRQRVAELRGQRIAKLEDRVAALERLCTRARDAIQEHCIDGFWDCKQLLDDLRKATEK